MGKRRWIVMGALILSACGSSQTLPTVAVLPSVTSTSGPTFTPSLTETAAPSVTITDTPAAVAQTAIAATPQPGLAMTMEPETYYLVSETNVRSCPQTDCARLTTLLGGMPITVMGVVNGEEVNERNWIWYLVDYQGETGYVYSERASLTPPTPRPTSAPAQQQQVQSSPVSQPQAARPRNCSTAVAMGLSAEQAAAAGLDRDGDGVACYGD